MSVSLPGPFLVGKNCSVLGVSGDAIDATGATLTPGAATSFLGRFDGFEVSFTASGVDIHAANATLANNVVTYDDFEARITEIIPANGNSVLLQRYLAFDYFTVTAQCAPNNGTGTAGGLLTLTGSRASCTYQIVEGKNVAVLTLRACGVLPTFA